MICFVRFGGTEAGTFCALSTLAEQVQHDNSVDVYMVSKLYHLKRPGIFSSQVRTLDRNKIKLPVLNDECSDFSTINELKKLCCRDKGYEEYNYM